MRTLSILTLSFFLSVSFVFADDLSLEVPTPCANIIHTLRIGTDDERTNGDVTSLQSFLQDEGYLSVDPTGYYGSATAKAVKKFQSKYGISPVGIVGSVTRKKIKSLTCNQVPFHTFLEDTNSTNTLSGLKLLQSKLTLELLPLSTITFPNASSTLKMGQSYNISWDTSEPSSVNYVIHLIGGAFGTTDYVLGRVPAGQKTLTWSVPASLTPGSLYKILIESENGNRSVGQMFSLLPPDQNTPVIKYVSSTQGRAYDKITITGSNFSSKVTLSTIQFLKDNKIVGYLDPSIKNPYAISIDGSQINFTVDPLFAVNNPAGVYQLRVANPFGDGYAYSNAVNFTLVK